MLILIYWKYLSLLQIDIMGLSNNDIFKKLRVALQLRDDEIVEILKLVDFQTTKSELGAFFRKEDHPKYRECGDQILRNFLNGLVIHLRGPRSKKPDHSHKNTPKKRHDKPTVDSPIKKKPGLL